MAKTEKSAHPQHLLDAYDRLIAAHPGLERKGATMPYTSMNGNMSSYLSKEGVLALRLPKDVLAEFIEKHKAGLMEAYGIVQKEYAAVPGSILKDTKKLQPYFDKSVAYVSGLKPKK